MKVELEALPTAPYSDKIQKTTDWEAFLSFGGSEGVGWYQSQQYYTCKGLGSAQLKLPPDQCIYDEQFNAASAVTGDPQDVILHKLALFAERQPARDLPLAAELPACVPRGSRRVRSRSIRTSASRSSGSSTGPTTRSVQTAGDNRHRYVMQAPAGRLPSQAQEAPWAPTSFAGS